MVKMKATLSINTRKAIEREVAKELERQRSVVYRQAAEDLMPQALAFFLWTTTSRDTVSLWACRQEMCL